MYDIYVLLDRVPEIYCLNLHMTRVSGFSILWKTNYDRAGFFSGKLWPWGRLSP